MHRPCDLSYSFQEVHVVHQLYLELYKERRVHASSPRSCPLKVWDPSGDNLRDSFILSEEPRIRAERCLRCSRDPHWFPAAQTVWQRRDLWPESAPAVQPVPLRTLGLAVLCPSLQSPALWFWFALCRVRSVATPSKKKHKKKTKSDQMRWFSTS